MISPDSLMGFFKTEHVPGAPSILEQAKHIVGFQPIELANEPPKLDEQRNTEAKFLRFLKDKGNVHSPITHDDEHRSTLMFSLKPEVPLQHFAITEELIVAVESLEITLQRRLTETELELVALCCVKDAVNPQFTPDAANVINSLYYAQSSAFSPENRLATLFVENHIINQSLGSYLARTVVKPTLQIHEICAGGRSDKWADILAMLNEKQSISLTLSDFIPPASPNLSTFTNVQSIESIRYSLFDELPEVPDAEKVDVMLATYGFDSVWLKQDARYLKENGKWYRELNRVKVLDSHPNKPQILAALKSGQSTEELTLQDFGSILIETAVEEVDIESVPFGSQISQFYEQVSMLRINFPGGMLAKVMEAFENQLSDDGVFLIGETTCYQNGKLQLSRASSVTGIAARYKIEDYFLAKNILENCGFTVEIQQLDQLANSELGDWESKATTTEIDQIKNNPLNIIMIIRKAI